MSGRHWWRPRGVDLGLTGLLTVLALGPVLFQRGFSLRGDMVFVPDQPWKSAWLGLDGSVPRSVPMDAVVWLLSQLLPGDVVQKGLLAGSFVVAGLGIACLLRNNGWLARAAAITLYLWNPWVHERLAIGQWACVAAYALLPWLVITTVRWRDGIRRGWAGTTILLVLSAVCAPSMGLLAIGVCAALLLTRPRTRTLLAAAGIAVLASFPWLVPSLLRPSIRATPGQFADFAGHAESALGVLASIVSLGGIWKTSVVPPERTVALIVLVSVLLTLVALAGLVPATRSLGRRTVLGLGLAAFAAVLVAVLPAVGPIASGLGRASTSVPALGILRDSQRYLPPLALLLAVGVAALVDHVLDIWRDRQRGLALACGGLLVMLPVLLLPSLAWGLHGQLTPVHYPAQWNAVASTIAAGNQHDPGATVVLPWHGSYRGFGWNDHRAVLDPAPRLLPGEVLIDDRMFVGASIVQSEDPYLSAIGDALDQPDAASALRALGVRWVLVEEDNGVHRSDIPHGALVNRGRWLSLVDLGAPGPSTRERPVGWPILTGDAITLGMLIVTSCTFWRRAM